jgi:formylglycine-generating enzyme required for sulfatase activity/class 3 adenylate cyclase
MTGESSTGVTSGQRRLAAIMSADIAGFSRLMEHDEEGTHARMKRLRRDIIEPTIAEHNGHIVKHMGDGFLAIFDSPLEATRCAIVIQQTIAARNAALGKQFWLQYRIGLNLGDVLVEPDDIYGDGVNVAARLQAAAEPGQVNISGGVYEQVKNKLVCGYQSLGDEKLKNITDPVRIYRVLPDPASVEKSRGRVQRIASIGLPVAAALVLAFGGGIWFAAQMYRDRHPAPAASLTAAPPIAAEQQQLVPPARPNAPSQPVTQPASRRDVEAVLPPTPPAPGPLPPIGAAEGAQSVPGTRVAVVPPTITLRPPTADANVFRDCQHCPEMIRIPGGTLMMGSNEDATEKPIHQVTVPPFAIGSSPVTVAEWRACVEAKGCNNAEPSADDDNLPVSNVSWDDAQEYVTWLAQVTSKPYRLPSEAEWEYAARGGTTTAYWWGAQFVPGMANCKGCGGTYDPSKPTKVGLLPANPFGVRDVSGSVSQWVADCWHSSYQGAPRNGIAWSAPNCRQHVLRGGSWRNDASDLRVASRAYYESGVRYPTHGFRVAVTEK